ncbi:fumarylacetoacetate hydrolase family protein [Roseimaritima sediminicola]|uniref:fumarylacetoacetate hydrolase family protein n=1 Tax=Roseimaritima sediminicola TaxID=2662066 RepID=UPI001F45377F|nr:fumarylacetoacetate hydrolase family protein [Roseimaritima sediminicola]
MRFCRFQRPDQSVELGLVQGDSIVALRDIQGSAPSDIRGLMALGETDLQRVVAAADARSVTEDVKLLPPVDRPEKVLCIGLNYRDHATETGSQIPAEPVVFCKLPTAVIGHEDQIVLPPQSSKVDYEAELVVVVGREAKNIAVEDALQYVFGYCCGNDVSARDWQKGKPGGQWLLGKTFDTFAPLGPYLVHHSAIDDPGKLRIRLRLNDQTLQDSTTEQLIFSIPEIVSYLSQVVTLRPGDLIYTGTPSGVGDARTPPVYLKSGDRCEVEIEGLGTLRNHCV